VWTVEEERQESEVPDSTGIRRQARNQERVAKEGNSTLGLTEWLVPTILLVSVESSILTVASVAALEHVVRDLS
jgi:hypothetical protein